MQFLLSPTEFCRLRGLMFAKSHQATFWAHTVGLVALANV